MVLTRGIPLAFRDGVHIYRQPPSGQSKVYRVTEARTDEFHCRESVGPGPVVLRVVPVTGDAFSGVTVDQFLSTPLFPHSTNLCYFWYVVDMCDIRSSGHMGATQYQRWYR